MSEERYYAPIGKVKVASEEEANALLGDGWELLSIKDMTITSHPKEGEGAIVTTSPAFILGLQRGDIQQPNQPAAKSAPPTASVQPAASVSQLAARIAWKDSTKNPSFSWAYATSKDEAKYPVPREVSELVAKIKAAGRKVQENGYEYSLSDDGRFLQRIKHKEEPEHPQ